MLHVGLGLGSGLDLVFKYSVVFAGNTIDVMLTHDHDDNSLFLDLLLLAIFKFPIPPWHVSGAGAAKLPLIVQFRLRDSRSAPLIMPCKPIPLEPRV